MTEKDKMIEELAKVICLFCKERTEEKECEHSKECYNWRLKELSFYYDLAYRIIAEGSVVLSKEEYSDYLTLKTDYAHAKEQCEKLQADIERLYKNLDKFKSLTRLGTAEEIYEYLDKSGVLKTAPDRIKMFFKRRFGVEVKE